jgi:c-di-GMP-related signal transduction protein
VDVLLARQAILDRDKKLYGYELLFRSDPGNNTFDGTSAAAATMQVLSNTVLSIGAHNILGGSKAFVNFDHELLAERMYLTLPRESLVIEILETVAPTKDLLELCQTIQQKGYAVALDDFVESPAYQPLARMADVIKVDIRLSSPDEQERLIHTYKRPGVLLLAEKIETDAEFQWTRRAGYDLFQGYFFARPMIVRSQQIPAAKANCLRLLREVQQTTLNLERVGELIETDVSLTYRCLRYANSALFQRRGHFDSVTRALVAVGEENIRRWVALATLPMLATDKPGELVKLSLARARFCERLAQTAHAVNRNEAFLMGMFSLLDALIDQPLDQALESLELKDEITEAILGTATNGFLPRLKQLVHSYEAGRWDEVDRCASQCGISPAETGDAYLDAADWADGILKSL